MSLLTSLDPYIEEIKLAAIVLAAGVVFAGGYHLGGLGPKAALSAEQAADWQAKYQASQVALSTVQGQLAQEQKTTANNSKDMKDLTDANAKIAADRDSYVQLAQRLLNSAKAAPRAGGGELPETGGGPAIAGPGPAPGDGQAAGLLADVATECLRNAAQLNSLISEITPQL